MSVVMTIAMLCFPTIVAASDSEPPPTPVIAEAKPLDAATLAALGIEEPSRAVAATTARSVAPEAGAWSWTSGAYSYDPSGNITAIGTQSFLYDVQGRLVDATVTRPGASEHRGYSYDSYGNRTAMEVGSSQITTPTSTSTNHLTSLSAVYDAAGNVTQLQPPGQSVLYQYKYDALGALQEVKAANVASTPTEVYIYTADEERLWTFDLAAEASHWKIRDLNGKVLRDYYVPGTTWTLSRDYIYRDGQLLAAVTPDDTLYFSLDHLGTPRVITSSTRSRLGFHHYLPFGEEWTDETGAQEGEPMKFTGHERDADVAGGSNGLDYMHARYYAASVGHFLSVDPVWASADLGKPQSWNRYAYVMNNPVNMTDPDGRKAIVRRDGNRIAIEIPIRFSGRGASPERIAAFTSAVQTQWSGTFGKYEVTTQITKGGFFDNRVRFETTPGDKDHRSEVTGGRFGTMYTYNDPNVQAAVDSHEAGHLMNHDDKYKENGDGTAQPLPGWEGNIMAQVPGATEEKNVDEILEENRVRDVKPDEKREQ